MKYDDIVIGLGAMGSSTVYELTKRGRKTLGIDAGKAGETRPSGDGSTRIVRTAIGDDGAYTPFARRSDVLLDDLEQVASLRLRMKTGGLLVRTPGSKGSGADVKPFEREAASARSYGIDFQWLEAKDVRRRFSPLRLQLGEIGYYEPSSGYVKPGYVVSIQLGLARHAGAEIHRGERVLSFRECEHGVSVETEHAIYRAERLIVCIGAWEADWLGEARAPRPALRHETVYRFDVADEKPFLPENFPVFTWEQPNSYKRIHGFPAVDGKKGGVMFSTEQGMGKRRKAQKEHERTLSREEASMMHKRCIAPRMLGVTSQVLNAWTRTCAVPSVSGIVVDRRLASQAVTVVTAGTGYGSRYAPAIGEAIAQIVTDGRSALDLSIFRSEPSRDPVATA